MLHLLTYINYYLGQSNLKLCIPKKFVRFSACYGPFYLRSARTLITVTASIKTNKILTLRTPEVSSTLKETDDDVEFVTDMEEPVCEGSEKHNHHQERHQHEITVIYFGFLRIATKETTVGWIIVLNSF